MGVHRLGECVSRGEVAFRVNRLAFAVLMASFSPSLLADIVGSGGISPNVNPGPNDVWNLGSANLNIGIRKDPNGKLDVTGGGKVITTGPINVAHTRDATGIFNIDGAQSRVTTGTAQSDNTHLSLGNDGVGRMTISGGASLLASRIYIGRHEYGDGYLVLKGSGSKVNTRAWVRVGNLGKGYLELSDGAELAAVGVIDIGHGGSAAGTGTGSALITGRGTKISGSSITVGRFSKNSEMTLTDNAQASTLSGFVGREVQGSGAKLTVSRGASWEMKDDFHVGYSGTGTLNLLSGGRISSSLASIGTMGGSGGEANISGSDTLLKVGNALVIGDLGSAQLNLSNKARIESGRGFLGQSAGGSGSATLSGEGSLWQMDGALHVGYRGTGDLLLQSGARINSASASLATLTGSTGKATVSGSGTLLNVNGALAVGGLGTATLDLNNQAKIESGSGLLGQSPAGIGTATVKGSGTHWQVKEQLLVGNSGSGTLALESGARVSSGSTTLGTLANATGTVTVSGSGSLLEVRDTLIVGGLGSGGLNVSGQAKITSANSVLGQSAASTGTATLSGSGTQWLSSGDFIVGQAGSGSLSMDSNVLLKANTVTVAEQSGSDGTVAVRGGATIETSQLRGGGGTASLKFDGGVLRATQDNNDFVKGFTSGSLLGSGLIIDTQDYNVGLNTSFATGSGGLVKQGTGTLFARGTSTYTGNTQIKAGRLQADESQSLGAGTIQVGGWDQPAELRVMGGVNLPNAVNVEDKGQLTGIGTIGTTVLKSGAVVMPGLSAREFGVLTMAGDLTFESGSFYEVNLDKESGIGDEIVVTGTANLSGGRIRYRGYGNSYQPGQWYEVLSAGAIVGEFDDVAANYAFLNLVANYQIDQNKVYLGLERKPELSFRDLAYTRNQRATAAALDQMGFDDSVYLFIETLPEGEPARFYDLLSGEIHASARSSLLAWTQRTAAANSLALRSAMQQSECAEQFEPNPETGQCQRDNEWRAWLQTIGDWSKRPGDGNAASGKTDTRGAVLGVQREIADSGWQVGGSIAAGNASLKVNERQSTADFDHYSATVYTGKGFAAGNDTLNLSGALSYHHQRVRAERQVPRLEQNLKSSYKADTVQVSAELGYELSRWQSWQVEPYLGLDVTHQRMGNFTEKNGTAGLNSDVESETYVSSVVGLRVGQTFEIGRNAARLTADVGWRHRLGSTEVERNMAFNEGSPEFKIIGVPLARNSAIVDVSGELALGRNTWLKAGVGGEHGTDYRQHHAEVGLRYDF